MRIFVFVLFAFIVLGATASVSAHEMLLTIYDDGLSCPGNCDAHVVINSNDNGTNHAFLPSSSRNHPAVCVTGQVCTICFTDNLDSCIDVTYRGAGPPRGKFDFTPAFYNHYCGMAGIPDTLSRTCVRLDAAVRQSGYDTRINCFLDPTNSKCAQIIGAATAAQQSDSQVRNLCLELGETEFNSRQSDPTKRRANACNYSQMSLGGPNSAGVTWKILLPGACRPGTLVGKDGLDCCSSDVRFAADVHGECSLYFPQP